MTKPIGQTLIDIAYMEFPFRITPQGAATCTRSRHVKDQIQQVLFTDPGERVFRPEFGAGLRRLVFEPNNQALATIIDKRLHNSLRPALEGEVDMKSLEINVEQDPAHPARVLITIQYRLVAIGRNETYSASVGV